MRSVTGAPMPGHTAVVEIDGEWFLVHRLIGPPSMSEQTPAKGPALTAPSQKSPNAQISRGGLSLIRGGME